MEHQEGALVQSPAPRVASYYNLWRSTNGVIAKAVHNHHREFFAALDRSKT